MLGWDPVEAVSAIRAARPQASVRYAADALDWHHARIGADPDASERQREALAAWRDTDQLVVVVRLIREQPQG